MLKSELVVNIDCLVLRSDRPSDRDILVFWNVAHGVHVLTVGGTTVHPQLIGVEFPVKNVLVGCITYPQILGVCFRHNRDLDRWAERIRRNQLVRTFQHDSTGHRPLVHYLAGPMAIWRWWCRWCGRTAVQRQENAKYDECGCFHNSLRTRQFNHSCTPTIKARPRGTGDIRQPVIPRLAEAAITRWWQRFI